MNLSWHPRSWENKPVWQLPEYPSPQLIDRVMTTLSSQPPLVNYGEVKACAQELAKVAKGDAFVLQAGDCAERFVPASSQSLPHMLNLLNQLRQHLASSLDKPIVSIGRIAGQYAKPRTRNFERRQDTSLPSYRGDMINDYAFTHTARQADPDRMLHAYTQAQQTLSLIHQTMPYLFASHEALILPYESALTRFDKETQAWYASSAHFLWIGNRTRQLEGAHIEWAKGIANPLGIKCSANLSKEDLRRLVDCLNPANTPGRLMLITRYGADKIEEHLPPLLDCVKREGFEIIWCCDPMHGNTHLTQNGIKTRSFDDIIAECQLFFNLVHDHGLYPGGLHLEITGDDVTECLGGPGAIGEQHLQDRYETYCDPRLNPQQCLELVHHVARMLKK